MQLARVLDQHHAVAGLGNLSQQRIDQRGLAGRGAAGDQDVLAGGDRDPQQLGLAAGHGTGRDVVAKREHGDGRAADGEARCGHHGRHQPLESLPASRQFGGNAGRTRVDFDADVVGDQTHDAFGVGGRDPTPRVFQPARKPINPEPAVGIEHHLDNAGVF